MNDAAMIELLGQSIRKELAKRDARLNDLETRTPEPGKNGLPGNDGAPGMGIKAVTQIDDRHFALTFDNDEDVTIELPEGPAGEKGDPGPQGERGAGLYVRRVAGAPAFVVGVEGGDETEIELPAGPQGERGVSGIDRPVLTPVFTVPAEGVERETVVFHSGGLWQAVRHTTGTPATDPAGYRVICNGVKGVTITDDWKARERVFKSMLSDGSCLTVSNPLPGGQPFADYSSDVTFKAADWFVRDSWMYTAAVDDAGDPQQARDDWLITPLRGARGRKGEKGDPGERGLPGNSISDLVLTRNGELIAMMDDGETRELGQLPYDDPDDTNTPIKRFMGVWDSLDNYLRGDQVRWGTTLFVATRPSTNRKPTDADYWQPVIGAGPSGGGPVGVTQEDVNATVAAAVADYLPLAGGDLSGDLTINGEDVATTPEVAAMFSVELADYLPLTGGTLTGPLTVNGKITATGDVEGFSDERLKKNFASITNCLARVRKIDALTFERRAEPDVRRAGLRAQAVGDVLPEAVSRNSQGMLSVSLLGMIGLLVGAVNELADKVEGQRHD